MSTWISRRPGADKSFSIPAVTSILQNLALPSEHLLEVEQRSTDGGWSVVTMTALPDNPTAHKCRLVPGIDVQRGVASTSQTSGGIRGGSITLRGNPGLREALAFDEHGDAVYAGGKARGFALRNWIRRYVEMLRDARNPGSPMVRLVYRNLEMGEAWIVRPTMIEIGQDEQSPIAYPYTLEFEILGERPQEPQKPGIIALLESYLAIGQAVAMTASGAAIALATVGESVGTRVGQHTRATVVDPLKRASVMLAAVGTGASTLWQAPMQAAVDGANAARALPAAAREAGNRACGRYDTVGADPNDDPDRDGLSALVLQYVLSAYDTAHALDVLAFTLEHAARPTVERIERVLPDDDDESLSARVELSTETLARLYGADGPIVDPTGMISGALIPGESVPVGAVADGETVGARLVAEALTPESLYGINLELGRDGDLVPEDGASPEGVKLVGAALNLEQGLRITLDTVRRSNLSFPALGIDAPIGEADVDRARVAARVVEALLEDDRVRTARPRSTEIEGSRIIVAVDVDAWGTGLQVTHGETT